MEAIEKYLRKQSRNCAQIWFALQVQCGGSFYLYFRRGELVVDSECPVGFELGTGERIRPCFTEDQAAEWIYSIARKLPCLPTEDQLMEDYFSECERRSNTQ